MKKIIFIVDDEQAICEGVCDILNKPAYEVLPFANGEDALNKFNTANPDLCIIDYKMPGMNGLELAKRLKKIKPNIQIILLTGSLLGSDDKRAYDLELEEVLDKPVTSKNLLASVRKALNEGVIEEGESINPEDGQEDGLTDFFKKNKDEWKKGSVLVVDDDKELLESLAESLTVNNYDVTTACNGNEAVDIARSGEFDIILMDIHMPEMNGIEAVNRIKSINPKAFIILISGEADDEEIREAIAKGGYACLNKPFTIKKLLKSLEWYMRAGKDIKERYLLDERMKNKSKILKIFVHMQYSFKRKFETNKMMIMTLLLTLSSIILGILLIFFIESTGNSIAELVDRGWNQYEDYAERVIGYLRRDEKRELNN